MNKIVILFKGSSCEHYFKGLFWIFKGSSCEHSKRSSWEHFRGFCDCLKTLDTMGNCQRPVFWLGVSQHMHKITNLWKFRLNRSSSLRDKNERKKNLSHEVWRPKKSNSEVTKSNSNIPSGTLLLFSKTTSLRRELFLSMIYTINSSRLLVTK